MSTMESLTKPVEESEERECECVWWWCAAAPLPAADVRAGAVMDSVIMMYVACAFKRQVHVCVRWICIWLSTPYGSGAQLPGSSNVWPRKGK